MSETIQDVVESILTAIGGERLTNTVDTFKSGDPAAPCTGIVTTFMATFGVLKAAADLGANLVITHEPTYYGHRDETAWLEGDAVFEAKHRFIEESGIVIWRFHDYWHRFDPDGIQAGVVDRLRWVRYQDAADRHFFTIPETTLTALAVTVKGRLKATVLRVTGRPSMACSRIALAPGAVGAERQIKLLAVPDVQVLIVGESPEWTACEYVRDALEAGQEKALILAGHCNSEEAGMEFLAEWLRPHVGKIEVNFVPAGDPFWAA
jgi:putative NIF3 family GTP cyclohydrolase 1 type 2